MKVGSHVKGGTVHNSNNFAGFFSAQPSGGRFSYVAEQVGFALISMVAALNSAT